MDEQQRLARIEIVRQRALEAIRNRKELPQQQWWLSFADESGFKGVVISHGNEFVEALMDTTLHDCNPGGEVKGFPLPGPNIISPEWTYRVLSKEEAERLDNLLEKCADARAEAVGVAENVRVCDFCIEPLPKNKPFRTITAQTPVGVLMADGDLTVDDNAEWFSCITCYAYIQKKNWTGLMHRHIHHAIQCGALRPILPLLLDRIRVVGQGWSLVFGPEFNIRVEDVLAPPKHFIKPGSA